MNDQPPGASADSGAGAQAPSAAYMSLLDHFAGCVLAGFYAFDACDGQDEHQTAACCYAQAAAMMELRRKITGGHDRCD